MMNSFTAEILNQIDAGILVLNSRFEIVFWNDYLKELTGYSLKEVNGQKLVDLYPAFERSIYQKFFNDVLTKEQNIFCSNALHDTFIEAADKRDIKQNMLMEYIFFEGEEFILLQIFDVTNQAKRVQLLKDEIRKRKEVERKLQRKSEEQKLLLDNIDIHIWYLKDEQTYGLVNNCRANFLGFSKEVIEDKLINEIYKPQDAEAIIAENKRVFQEKKKLKLEKWVDNSQGQRRLLAITKIPKLNQQGEVEYVVCSAEDITTRKRKEERIKYLSYHDSLTNLYNRSYYEEMLEELNEPENLPLSIILGDVNGLKLTNDVFDHDTGDQLLIEAGKIIRSAVRADDIVARWGGDEFGIILPGANYRVAKRIIKRIEEGCQNSDLEPISPSIALGAATKKESKQSIKHIFKEAESRMYSVKKSQKEGFENPLLRELIARMDEDDYKVIRHTPLLIKYAWEMGEILELKEYDMNRLLMLARIHDLGKLVISKEILNKEDTLTDLEWEEYKSHVKLGYQMANSFPVLENISDLILHHHEKWDGSGYPDGLAEEEIPILSRLLHLLDFFDSLQSEIYYPLGTELYFKQSLEKEEIISLIKKFSGQFFDPDLVEIFLNEVVQ